MYCEDNLGTDIDHFQPIAVAPERAFDWPNHLLACSHCNSNQKRDEYPCDPDGNALLVDPSREDPAEHLTLLLASGEYQPESRRGAETIRVFDLNRIELRAGRQDAFVTAQDVLVAWHRHHLSGASDKAERRALALRRSPFAAVLRAMERLPDGAAAIVLDPATFEAIRAWK
ncbi:HNH endonuclease [Kitasatospora sp. NPDC004289]